MKCIVSLKDWNPTGTITFLLPGTRGVFSCGERSRQLQDDRGTTQLCLLAFSLQRGAVCTLFPRRSSRVFFFPPSWLPCWKLTSTTNLISRLCSFETVTFGSSLTNRISFQRVVPLADAAASFRENNTASSEGLCCSVIDCPQWILHVRVHHRIIFGCPSRVSQIFDLFVARNHDFTTAFPETFQLCVIRNGYWSVKNFIKLKKKHPKSKKLCQTTHFPKYCDFYLKWLFIQGYVT